MIFQTRHINLDLSRPVPLAIAVVLGLALLVGLVVLVAFAGVIALAVGLIGSAMAGLTWTVRRMFNKDGFQEEEIKGMLDPVEDKPLEIEMIDVEVIETQER